ncbi:MAG TPA: hypothetical protein PK655_02955 [archaeon]|nr:hypothetical protein [archaeon]
MENTNHSKKGIILLFIILISISISGFVFSDNVDIMGLYNSQTGIATCNYNSQTGNCILNGGDYNIVGSEIRPSRSGINLVINQNANFNVSCVTFDTTLSDCFILNPDINKINIMFSDFNLIKINEFTTIKIDRGNLTDTQIDFRNVNNLILGNKLDVNISKNACLGEYYINGYLYSYVPESNILFNRIEIKNTGTLNIINNKNYVGYEQECNYYYSLKYYLEEDEENEEQTPNQQTYNLNTDYFADIISFEQVDNNGTINLNCSTKVDNTIYLNNTCNFHFKSITGNLPTQIINANNYGNLYLSTCGPISLPSNINYKICNLSYVRPEGNLIDLNTQNTGVTHINKVNKSCSPISVSNQISEYLFTSDSNITSTPIIFGTINSAITYNPLDVSLDTAGNAGLYNTKNLNHMVSNIFQTENIFFKLFLYDQSIDTNLLDSYLFRFKLNSNQDMGYPDITLEYPFKIHK